MSLDAVFLKNIFTVVNIAIMKLVLVASGFWMLKQK
jgi:hypothetical protein